MPSVNLPQILWHSKDNKHSDRVYSLDFKPQGHNFNSTDVKSTKLATAGADEFVHVTCHSHRYGRYSSNL